jgi:hypothetical protein
MPSCQNDIEGKVKSIFKSIQHNTSKPLQGLLFNVNSHQQNCKNHSKNNQLVKENKHFKRH